jgi:hypothetical protein
VPAIGGPATRDRWSPSQTPPDRVPLTMVTSRFTEAVTLAFTTWTRGHDRGAPIVFVPGMTDIAEDYTEVLPLFGRRAVVAEIRGHGRSSTPAGGYDLATLSTEVGAVIRRDDPRIGARRDILPGNVVRRRLGARASRASVIACNRRLRAGGACPVRRHLPSRPCPITSARSPARRPRRW